MDSKLPDPHAGRGGRGAPAFGGGSRGEEAEQGVNLTSGLTVLKELLRFTTGDTAAGLSLRVEGRPVLLVAVSVQEGSAVGTPGLWALKHEHVRSANQDLLPCLSNGAKRWRCLPVPESWLLTAVNGSYFHFQNQLREHRPSRFPKNGLRRPVTPLSAFLFPPAQNPGHPAGSRCLQGAAHG